MDQTNRHNTELMSAGLNLIAQAMTIYDNDLKLAVCNARFREMFDLPERLTTPGADFAETIRYLAETGEYGTVDDLDAFIQIRVQQARAFEAHYMERTRANGRTISVEGSPLPQGGWVAVYTDITRTKRSEQLLRAHSAELSDQVLAYAEELSATNRELAATITTLEETKRQLTLIEARTRMTTEMMPAHIAHVDEDGCYTYSNRQLSLILPGRPSNIIGRPIADALGASAFGRIEPHLKDAYAGKPSVFEFTDSSTSRRLRVAFTPDRKGGVYILSMDITEETQARVALQQSRRRALAAQMTNGLAHDFSNLLTIIMGMQGKLSKLDLPEDAADLIAATLGAARRGGSLLKRIGDMTGRRTLRPHPTNLHGLLEELRILATPTLPPSIGLSVLDHTPDGLVMLDADMLSDALLNLTLNARDACGTSGQITVSAHVVPGIWIEISVTDTGPGFSQDALDHALEPFFTTKGGEGSGLGLPMVYDMVKLAGGDLRLSNTPTGASVVLRVPLRPAPQVAGGLVLLVEDNDDLRVDIRDMLIPLGYAVIEAASVDEALALSTDLPDIAVVLSDIRLQDSKTGLDLRNQLQGQNAPIILMTSLPEHDPLHRAAIRGGPVLAKPFSAAELTALLNPEVPV